MTRGSHVTKTELKSFVNMTPRELRAWDKDKRRKLASGTAGWTTLKKLPPLLEKAGRDWTRKDRELAAKVIAFIKRHTAQKSLFGAEVGRSGYSGRHIALRNWGHDVTKPTSELYVYDGHWLRRHRGAEERRG